MKMKDAVYGLLVVVALLVGLNVGWWTAPEKRDRDVCKECSELVNAIVEKQRAPAPVADEE